MDSKARILSFKLKAIYKLSKKSSNVFVTVFNLLFGSRYISGAISGNLWSDVFQEFNPEYAVSGFFEVENATGGS
jgi:hypothetical protein